MRFRRSGGHTFGAQSVEPSKWAVLRIDGVNGDHVSPHTIVAEQGASERACGESWGRSSSDETRTDTRQSPSTDLHPFRPPSYRETAPTRDE